MIRDEPLVFLLETNTRPVGINPYQPSRYDRENLPPATFRNYAWTSTRFSEALVEALSELSSLAAGV